MLSKLTLAVVVLAAIAAVLGAAAARRTFDPESARSPFLDPRRLEDRDGEGAEFGFHGDKDESLGVYSSTKDTILFSRRGDGYTLIVELAQGTQILERAVKIGFTSMSGRLRVCGTTLLVDPPRVRRNDLPRNVIVSFDLSVRDVLDIADCGSFELVTERGEIRIEIPDGAAESLRWNVKQWTPGGERTIRNRYSRRDA